jgi:hypothetical protein
MLGKPTLDLPPDAEMKTRFKMWYRLVGSAVEHATKCMKWTDADCGELPEWDQLLPDVDFANLFLSQEASDDDETDLGETLNALDAMAGIRGGRDFRASDVAKLLNDSGGTDNAIVVRNYFFPTLLPDKPVSAKSVSKHLKARRGEPAKYDGRTLVLRTFNDAHEKILKFRVDIL